MDDDANNAYSKLCTRLANAPILIYSDFRVQFLFHSDASDKGIGVVLSQIGKDQLDHPIAYFSRTLGKHKRNYSIRRNELLAAIKSNEHYRCYLYKRQFVLRTDHVVIKWLKHFKKPTCQLARLLERLSAYDFIVQHRPGRKHLNADALS